MSEIIANTITKHVKLKAVIEEGQEALAIVSKRGNEHQHLHIMNLEEAREWLTQCLVALNVANSPPPQPKKEKGSVQVKLVGTLPKDSPADYDFEQKCKEADVGEGYYIRVGGMQVMVSSIRPSQFFDRVHVTVVNGDGAVVEMLPTWEALRDARLEQKGML